MNKKTKRELTIMKQQMVVFQELIERGTVPDPVVEEMKLHIQAGSEVLYFSDKLKKSYVDEVLTMMMERMMDRLDSHMKPLMAIHKPYHQAEWGEA